MTTIKLLILLIFTLIFFVSQGFSQNLKTMKDIAYKYAYYKKCTVEPADASLLKLVDSICIIAVNSLPFDEGKVTLELRQYIWLGADDSCRYIGVMRGQWMAEYIVEHSRIKKENIFISIKYDLADVDRTWTLKDYDLMKFIFRMN